MKKLTLILSLMLALVGLKANAAMYIVGNNPFGDWHTYSGAAMTDNGNGVYTYVTDQIDGTVWFVFADNLTTGTSNDWDTFNGNYRYGPLTAGQAINPGTEYTTQKSTNGNVSYSFSGAAGQSYQFTFDTNTMKFKVDGYVPPVEYTSFTVVGNNADIFGEEWNVALTQNDMTLGEDGVYKLTKSGVEIAAGDTLQYKVVANHSWDHNWGETPNGENKKEYFEESGIYDITFFFDPENEFVTIFTALVGPLEINSLTVVGNNADIFGEEWNPELTQNDMTLDEDGVYKLTKNGVEIAAGYTLEYKVAANHSWKFNWGETYGGENKKEYFQESGIYDITFFFDPENEVVAIFTALVGPAEITSLTVVGNNTDIFGEAWNPELTQNDMTLDATDGVYKLTKNGIAIPADYTLEYKVAANHRWTFNWGETYGGENKKEHFQESGIYDMTFFFDLENEFVTIFTVKVGELPEPTADPVYIMGNVNGLTWDAINGVQMTYDETTKVYTAEINVTDANNGKGYFGFTKQLADTTLETDVWEQIAPYRFGPVCDPEAENWVMTENLLGTDCALDMQSSKSIEIPAGTWTVTVDLNTNVFKINGEWPTDTVVPEPYTGEVYILGDVNDNGGWFTNKGVKMTRDAENNVYTATITTTGEAYVDPETNIGYSYFSFTKQLADSAADWAAIAPYRFGAISEGDFLVTEEQLNKELSLEMNGEPDAFKITAGQWNLTLSVDKMTLVITKAAGKRGDVNGDGNVDITDATTLINFLLYGDATGIVQENANCDLQNNIDISDATTLINFLLYGSWGE